jgi:hypothetical protein
MAEQTTARQDEIFVNIDSIWDNFLDSLERSLESLEHDIREVKQNAEFCTLDWCATTDKILAELVHMLYSLHVPGFVSGGKLDRLNALRKKVHDVYAKFVTVSSADKIFV